MDKKIRFGIKPQYRFVDRLVRPAVSAIPQWFKDIPAHYDKSGIEFYKLTSATVKRCLPVSDALTTGYFLTLPADIYVRQENGKTLINWLVNVPVDIANPDNIERYEGFVIPEGHEPQLWRIAFETSIQTPPGYSTLFTHPFNRFDLPFTTMSGVIDTDGGCPTPVANIFIKSSFQGVIEKGTPIVQLFPFKRNNWASEVFPANQEEISKHFWQSKSSFARTFYRNNIWFRKSYK